MSQSDDGNQKIFKDGLTRFLMANIEVYLDTYLDDVMVLYDKYVSLEHSYCLYD